MTDSSLENVKKDLLVLMLEEIAFKEIKWRDSRLLLLCEFNRILIFYITHDIAVGEIRICCAKIENIGKMSAISTFLFSIFWRP